MADATAPDGARSRRLLAVGGVLIAALALVAAAAPWLTPYDPAAIVVGHYAGPLPVGTPGHPLGTDTLGRDLWARLAYGARTSLLVGALAMAINLVIGVAIGLLAGYFGGWVDAALMWLVDLVLTMPTLLLLIVLATVLPPTIYTIPLVIGVVGWTTFARTVRGEVLSLKERDYLLAARALGASHGRILLRHLLPGVLPGVIVLAALGMSAAIGIDAGLSYLGLGVPLPTPSWGRMISDAQTYFAVAPSLVVLPGVAIALAVIGFNLIGNGLTDVLGPRRS
ncbi:MAG TPA: ABC transporter permease [Candidatus Binatia bacterium]|nr:ABC transporter permease [Candidatus Binatia bacterium]